MNITKSAFALLLMWGLGACSNLQMQMESTRSMALHGNAFQQALHQEYMRIADLEYDAGDLKDSVYFYRVKAEEAANGRDVEPVAPTGHKMSTDMEAEAVAAYERLQSAFAKGARESAPSLAATAQASFDCWVREWCESHAGIADCRERFLQAMADLEALLKPLATEQPQVLKASPVVVREYIVFFGFDSAELDEEAKGTLDAAAAAIMKIGQDAVIMVSGHTDTAGGKVYNQKLSEYRARSVKDYLVSKGIAAGQITTKGLGENDLPVPTPDGRREQGNRRAVIELP